MCILCIWSLFLCLACSNDCRIQVDKLNKMSYAYHYRNLDSTLLYAHKALKLSRGYSSGEAEALNNLAFVSIAKMEYKRATSQLDSIFKITDNQVELLVADIQYMRLCQRQAMNKEFYDYRERAKRRIRRIKEDIDELDEHLQYRFLYAETEYAFVSATYYYYIGMNEQSINELSKVSRYGLMQKDTAQYLNWLYQYGSGGMFDEKDVNHVLQSEYDLLLECYLIAKENGYAYWEANSLQSLSEHLLLKEDRDYLLEKNPVSMGFINVDVMPDSLLSGYLAQKSLEMFLKYGDVYQSAGGFRTLASCYWEISDYQSSLFCLEKALNYNKAILQAPDLVASIHEQFCIVYSSLNNKHNSDINRNIYLDMQERTRQDMELDARAAQLEKTSSGMNLLIIIILLLICLLFIFILILFRGGNKRKRNTDGLLKSLEYWRIHNADYLQELEDCVTEKEETKETVLLDVYKNKKRYIENLAKIFLIDSVVPLIDRMTNDVEKLIVRKETESQRMERMEYVSELADKIDEYNNVLTEWIQLRKGEVGLNIESFELNELFSIVARSGAFFSSDGIRLSILPTNLIVKADKALTLFMINTIADNARKFTDNGGEVRIYAKEGESYVEISVADTGRGMTQEQLSEVFSRSSVNGHGFGILNCRGIINKYRKLSRIFDVCDFSAQSTKGKGSRFFFRLPKGVMRSVLAIFILMLIPSTSIYAQISKKITISSNKDSCLTEARQYADSVYMSNINGNYHNTILYTDTVIALLNKHYLHINAKGKFLMLKNGSQSLESAELLWFKAGINTDYATILDIRNECAVAALALHLWDLYEYNNKIYTQLLKEVSADRSLGDYCRIMQKAETNKNIAIAILLILLVSLIVVSYLLYYRRMIKRHSLSELIKSLGEILEGDLPTEKKLESLSSLKKSNSFVEIDKGITKIEEELRASLVKENEYLDREETLEDDICKIRYEGERLHVGSNIIENCLSTIKHETMYYPSKIQQYIVNSNENSNIDVNYLKDLVSYYKEIYTILCEQVHRQVNYAMFKISKVDISSYLTPRHNVRLWGDEHLIKYMFELLRLQNNKSQPIYSVYEERDRYIVIKACMTNMKLSEQDCARIFTPNTQWIPLLTCRQIVRELSAVTNLCACGIYANRETDGETDIFITLPRVVNHE